MTRLLRIGFDMHPARASSPGIGRYTRELSGALTRTPGVHLERLTASDTQTTGQVSRLLAGARRNLSYYPAALDRMATQRDVDVLHCPGPMIPLRTQLPLVVTIHDVLAWRAPELFSRSGAAQQRLLVTRAARAADRIVVASEHLRRELVELVGIAPEQVSVIALGVDGRFRPITTEPIALAHRFGIPPQPFVLWVGSAEPRKNLGMVLRAFSLVRRRAPECVLVVVGIDHVTDPMIERELDQLGPSVIRPGFISDDDLAALYSATRCFVFPSLYEGFGLPLLEAMACGAPIVASDRTSIPEVLGDAGILVDAQHPDAIADGIEQVLLSESVAADLRTRGRARSTLFTWERCAALTAETYQQVTSGHPTKWQ